jgi:hypothetical protein
MKTTNKNFTEMNMKEIGSDTFFLFFDLILDNIQTEISQKNFNRAKNPGQDLSIGPSLVKIGLTNTEK